MLKWMLEVQIKSGSSTSQLVLPPEQQLLSSVEEKVSKTSSSINILARWLCLQPKQALLALLQLQPSGCSDWRKEVGVPRQTESNERKTGRWNLWEDGEGKWETWKQREGVNCRRSGRAIMEQLGTLLHLTVVVSWQWTCHQCGYCLNVCVRARVCVLLHPTGVRYWILLPDTVWLDRLTTKVHTHSHTHMHKDSS